MNRSASMLTVAGLVLAALAGCTYDNPKADTKPAAAPSPSVDCDDPTLNLPLFPECQAQLQGPAAHPHTWPNGFTARIDSLAVLDPKLADSLQPGQTLMKLTLTFGNAGEQPIPLEQGRWLWKLLSSPNHYEVDGDVGADLGHAVESEVPEQVAPGQTVTVYDGWDVPTNQMDVLALRVDLDGAIAPWTFTDVQTLLRS